MRLHCDKEQPGSCDENAQFVQLIDQVWKKIESLSSPKESGNTKNRAIIEQEIARLKALGQEERDSGDANALAIGSYIAIRPALESFYPNYTDYTAKTDVKRELAKKQPFADDSSEYGDLLRAWGLVVQEAQDQVSSFAKITRQLQQEKAEKRLDLDDAGRQAIRGKIERFKQELAHINKLADPKAVKKYVEDKFVSSNVVLMKSYNNIHGHIQGYYGWKNVRQTIGTQDSFALYNDGDKTLLREWADAVKAIQQKFSS